MTTTASILFGDPQDFGRISSVNRLAAGIVVSEGQYTVPPEFIGFYRQYANIATVTGFENDDNLHEIFIRAAVGEMEGYTQTAFMDKTVRDEYRLLYNTTILSETPVQAITKIDYVVGNSEPASVVGDIPEGGTMGNDTFDVTPKGELRFSPYFVQYLTDNIFTVSKFIVEYKVGRGIENLSDLPANVRLAIFEIAASMDWNRGADDSGMARKTLISPKVASLLNPYRQLRIA